MSSKGSSKVGSGRSRRKPRNPGARSRSKQRGARDPVQTRLLFGSQKNLRLSLGRLIRRFDADPRANVGRHRALVYSIRVLSDVMRRGQEAELLARLAAVEERLGLAKPDGTIIPMRGTR